MDRNATRALEALKQIIEDGELSGTAKYSYAEHIAELNEEAWNYAIERRVAAYDRGEITTYSAEDVFVAALELSE